MKLVKLVVLNTIFVVILYVLGREGYLEEAWGNDVLYIIPAVIVMASLGFANLWRDLDNSEWCAETCVSLGLLGTALGVWKAFSGIDPSMVGDINAIGAVIGVLLSGLGAALWTTMTGVFFNLWLTANIRLREVANA